jgi:hypothetical protein
VAIGLFGLNSLSIELRWTVILIEMVLLSLCGACCKLDEDIVSVFTSIQFPYSNTVV